MDEWLKPHIDAVSNTNKLEKFLQDRPPYGQRNDLTKGT
jgi:hypothetical protein